MLKKSNQRLITFPKQTNKNSVGWDGFTGESYQTCNTPILHNMFHEVEMVGLIPDLGRDASIIPTTKTRPIQEEKGKYRPISLMYMEANVVNKI